MPEIIYYVAMSLDGFIAPTDGSLEWLAPFEASAEDYGFGAFYDSVDTVLLGSRTYEQALGFDAWPYPGKPTWVFSSRVLVPARDDVFVTAAEPAEVAEELDRLGSRRAWLVGGGRLAGAFQSAGLIDEYIVSVLPVILGAGVGLLGGTGSLESLDLADTTRYDDGIVQCRYMPRG